MKKINYLLLMVLLTIPFLGAKADTSGDLKSGTLTYTITWAGQLAWYYAANAEYQSTYNCENATSLVLSGGPLNNADVQIIRKMINEKNLRIVDLSGATFQNDVETGDEPFDYPDNDGHNLAAKGAAVHGYGKYKCPWTGNDYNYGYCIAGEIGPAMFANCTNLQSITLPTNAIKIGTGAFFGCTSLASVFLSTNTTELGWECFYGCSNLQILQPENGSTFPNLVTVNSEAFKGCSKPLLDTYFQKLTGVYTIGYSAFENTQISQTSAQQIINQFQHGNVSSSDRGYYRIPEYAFKNCTNISGALNLTNTNIYGIDTQAFSGCTGLKGITLGANIDGTNSVIDPKVASSNGYLGDGAFAGCKNLGTVTVNAGVAPTCGTNVFGSDDNSPANSGPEPNDCEVVFSNTAATGTNYTSYRNNSTFMALLTKTMDEDNYVYDVVPQRHADVVLHRTFKEGWNTLALPFGSASDANKTPYGAQIFMNALHKTGNDFMIAAYRGLNTITNTFYFLQYATGTDPLDEFEPILVKMGSDDIASDGKYTFSNVEVNYDANYKKEYAAKDVNSLIGKLAGTSSKYVDGSYNHDMNTKFKNCSYGDFFFTGTLYKQTCTAAASASIENFIQAGDYIIQDNNFYKVAAGSNYGLKGFRGWFKQLKPSASGAKSSTFSIDVENNGGETTDIVKIDANGEEVKDMNNVKVYNINGQFVGTSLNGLSKGLYIVNGKKYVVK
jgi:hypothetical protein